jgi:hypothetical protein
VESYLVAIAVSVVVLAAMSLLAYAGFRNGDWTGEALARSLRRDLDAGEDRVPPG